MRGVYTIRKIDTHLHLSAIKRPYKTAYTELLRNRAETDKEVQDSKVKRWLKNTDKTNLLVEAALLQRWYPNQIPCSADGPPLTILPDKLRKKIHPAFEYDLEVDGNRIVRVHRIVKRPLEKKTMEALVTYLARTHNKRKRGLKPAGPLIRRKLGTHDWSTFTSRQLQLMLEVWFPLLESRPRKFFKQCMNTWQQYEETPTHVSAFLNGKASKMDMVITRACHHDDAITEQHTDTLDKCLELYRTNARSTAFETIEWLGPWFASKDEDLSCPTCLEPMSVPSVTACQHTFCADCVQKYTSGCPVCRQPIQPLGNWSKCLTWFEQSTHDRELAVQRALAERNVTFVTEPVDDDSYVVICAAEEDVWDWQYHFDNEQVYTLQQKPTGSQFMVYQAQHFTLEQWESFIAHWDVDIPAIIHGRVDVSLSFRGSLFRSLSKCSEESKRAPMGPVVSWDQRPEVEQYFVASSAAASTVHSLIEIPTRAWVPLPERARGVRRIAEKLPNGRYLFHDVSTELKVDVKKYQADAVSIHRWPAGRVDVGAFVVTSNTKGCIPCAIRRAQAFCIDMCHVICLDCPVPPLHCAHNVCKPTWRTTID